MANKYYNEVEALLWLQPDGINTDCQFLDCHDIADIVIPKGDVGRSVCVDPATGKYILGNRKQGPPGAPTTSVTAHVGLKKDWIEHAIDCPTTYYVHKVVCGDRRLFLNYERSWILRYAITTQRTLANMATLMTPPDVPGDSTQPLDLSADVVEDIFKLVDTRLVTTEDQPLRDIAGCTLPQCAGYCGARQDVCDDLVAVANCDTGAATAHVLVSHDHGITWTAAANDPFALNTANLSSVVCFKVGDGSETRTIAAKGNAVAGGTVSWSDDFGVTAWNEVTIGAVGNDFCPHNGGLFALDHRHIWAVMNSGDIWFSDDGGLSWTEQMPGLNANALNYVRFVDESVGLAVGATQTVLYTVDGGAHWNVLAGPGAVNLLCCDIFDEHRAWVGDSAGALYYTNNLGVGMVAGDWVQRVLPLPDTAVSISEVNDVMFVRDSGVQTNDHVGFVTVRWVEDTTYYGALYRTFNGGRDWEVWQTLTMVAGTYGLQAVWACEPNEAVAVGDLQAGTAHIIGVNGALP